MITAGDLPPKLEGVASKALGADFGNALAAGHAAGEADLVDLRPIDQIIADLSSGRNDIEHAGRQSDRFRTFGDDLRLERRFRRRLGHDGAAGEKRGGDSVRGQRNRRVPRRDDGDDANRFANDLRLAADDVARLDRFALGAELAVELEQLRSVLNDETGEALAAPRLAPSTRRSRAAGASSSPRRSR